jgi:WD40 repeat protein
VRLEARQRLAEHTGAIHSIVIDQLSRETLFTASEDKTIRVWTLSQQTDLWKCSQVGVWVSSDLLLQ